jgi:hypothetical protein
MALNPDELRKKIIQDTTKCMDDWDKKFGNSDVQKNEQSNLYGYCDHPNTMEDGTAMLLYMIAMIGGAIFNDRLIIWIISTIAFLKFITRHKE